PVVACVASCNSSGAAPAPADGELQPSHGGRPAGDQPAVPPPSSPPGASRVQPTPGRSRPEGQTGMPTGAIGAAIATWCRTGQAADSTSAKMVALTSAGRVGQAMATRCKSASAETAPEFAALAR